MLQIGNPFAPRVPTTSSRWTFGRAGYSYQSFVRELWSINAANRHLLTKDNLDDAWEGFADKLAGGDRNEIRKLKQQPFGPDVDAAWTVFGDRLSRVSES